MNAMGPLAKFAAALIGKQPEEKRQPRGFLGDRARRSRVRPACVKVDRVLPDSPAAKGGMKPGDRLIRIGKRAVKGLRSAYAAVAKTKAGDAS